MCWNMCELIFDAGWCSTVNKVKLSFSLICVILNMCKKLNNINVWAKNKKSSEIDIFFLTVDIFLCFNVKDNN